jgi:hypothetical protein
MTIIINQVTYCYGISLIVIQLSLSTRDHSPLSSAKVMNEQELYVLSPIRLYRCDVGLLYLLPLGSRLEAVVAQLA